MPAGPPAGRPHRAPRTPRTPRAADPSPAPRGICVLAVAPGMIDVPSMRHAAADMKAPVDPFTGYAGNIPAGRAGVPDDIACAVVFAVSDAASDATGSTLLINGGEVGGPTIKTMTQAMQPIEPADLPAEAMLAYFHHGANVACVAQRLRGLTLAAANHMPTPEVRRMRALSEKGTSTNQRLPHPADPTGPAQ